jgi:hypothetical protein
VQNTAEFLIDNLSILITFGFAGFVVYRQELSKSSIAPNELLTAILAVLAGSFSNFKIVERYRRLNQIEATFRDLEYLHKSWLGYQADPKIKTGPVT